MVLDPGMRRISLKTKSTKQRFYQKGQATLYWPRVFDSWLRLARRSRARRHTAPKVSARRTNFVQKRTSTSSGNAL